MTDLTASRLNIIIILLSPSLTSCLLILFHFWYLTLTFFLIITLTYPFKPQASSPNWSPYISLKNELREFDKRSRHFFLGDHFINSHNFSVDSVWILLGENWSWSLLGLKGLMDRISWKLVITPFSAISYETGSCLERNLRLVWGVLFDNHFAARDENGLYLKHHLHRYTLAGIFRG